MNVGLGAHVLRLGKAGRPDEAASYADGALKVGFVDCEGSRNG